MADGNQVIERGTSLESCIRYWEAVLRANFFLLDPSVKHILERTIKFLRNLANSRGVNVVP